MPRSRKTVLVSAGVAAVVIAAALLLYGSFRRGTRAQTSPGLELLSALPAGAPSLIYVDLAAVRASYFYQHRPGKGPIATPNQEYADFVRLTGSDFEKDLNRVAMASWPAPGAKEQTKIVAIAEGRFDRAKIRDYALSKGKLDHQQGREVFLFPMGDRMGTNSIVFLDDHRIAVVSGPSIAPLFAGRSDDPGGDPARERAARLDGAAAFAISRLPAVPVNSAAGGAPAAQLAALMRSIQWVTMAARPEGDNLRVSIEGECDTSTDAQQIKAGLELLRMFGSAGLASPKTRQSMDPATLAFLQTLLTTAEVTQAAERVRILIELTPDVFKLGDGHKPQ